MSKSSKSTLSQIWFIGSFLSAVSSFIMGNKIGWIVIHFVLSWAYLLYLCMGFGGGLPKNIF